MEHAAYTRHSRVGMGSKKAAALDCVMAPWSRTGQLAEFGAVYRGSLGLMAAAAASTECGSGLVGDPFGWA